MRFSEKPLRLAVGVAEAKVYDVAAEGDLSYLKRMMLAEYRCSLCWLIGRIGGGSAAPRFLLALAAAAGVGLPYCGRLDSKEADDDDLLLVGDWPTPF